MPGKLKHGDRQILTELNLIPLIDIALVLLIIFMVLTPVLVRSQIPVKLPKAVSGSSISKAVSVTLTSSGKVFVDGEPATLDGIYDALAKRLGDAREKTVLVEADRDVPIQKVVTVLDAGRKLGVGKLGVGVSAAQ